MVHFLRLELECNLKSNSAFQITYVLCSVCPWALLLSKCRNRSLVNRQTLLEYIWNIGDCTFCSVICRCYCVNVVFLTVACWNYSQLAKTCFILFLVLELEYVYLKVSQHFSWHMCFVQFVLGHCSWINIEIDTVLKSGWNSSD